jgi:hypothetical protein
MNKEDGMADKKNEVVTKIMFEPAGKDQTKMTVFFEGGDYREVVTPSEQAENGLKRMAKDGLVDRLRHLEDDGNA